MATRHDKRKAKREKDQATLGQRMTNRRLMLEVRKEASEFAEGLARNVDPASAVQFVLDNIASAYEYATQQMWTIPEEEYWRDTIAGKIPHEWVREQERLGLQLVHVAGKAAAMGLAERQVRMQEAQAAIFATVVEAVLVEVGLDGDKRRLVHQGIAMRLDDIVGTATELTEKAAA
mgnify:CR=1 FL=1